MHRVRCHRLIVLACAALLIAGCGQPSDENVSADNGPVDADPAAQTDPIKSDEPVVEQRQAKDVLLADRNVEYVEIEEEFVTEALADANLDSTTVWQDVAGNLWLYASGKQSNHIYMYDGEAGFLKGAVGGAGSEPGQFAWPNGIYVIRDLMLVVERDNHRVQVLSVPSMKSIGSFGDDILKRPYGIWVRSLETGYEAIVSDSFMDAGNEGGVPPLSELDRRFARFRFDVVDGELSVEHLGHFGATDSAGAIRIAESLIGDDGQRRLLIAEEEQSFGTRIKVYDMDGQYLSQDVGANVFKAQAEGIALFNCADGSGYVIASDQFKDRSLFHVFDRQTLALIGSFAGKVTANTDGVWLHQAPSKGFPDGVFYAVHDDEAIAAFDWKAIAGALEIRNSCY